MGLDTTHDCWHGSYTAFNRWRHKIAELAGIPLPLMEGFYEPPREEPLEWIKPRPGGPQCGHPNGPWLYHWLEDVIAALPLSWEPWELDPLAVLLNHSDCDGKLEAGDCGPIARRLEELLPELAELPDDPGHIQNWVQKTQRFIDGLRAAEAAGESVEFH